MNWVGHTRPEPEQRLLGRARYIRMHIFSFFFLKCFGKASSHKIHISCLGVVPFVLQISCKTKLMFHFKFVFQLYQNLIGSLSHKTFSVWYQYDLLAASTLLDCITNSFQQFWWPENMMHVLVGLWNEVKTAPCIVTCYSNLKRREGVERVVETSFEGHMHAISGKTNPRMVFSYFILVFEAYVSFVILWTTWCDSWNQPFPTGLLLLYILV